MSLLKLVDEMSWPTGPDSQVNAAAYQAGLDLVYSCAGDSSDLAAALERFRDCGSQAHAAAGVALTLMFAAYERGDSYNASALREAEKWIARIGPAVNERPELAFVPAQLALVRQDQKTARRLLDALHARWPDDFFVRKAELWYWYNQSDLAQCESWAEKTLAVAQTEVRKEIALTAAAGCYTRCRALEPAIKAYEQLTQLAPENAWHWHNLSLQYYNAGKLQLAGECNRRALSIDEFAAAREVEKMIADDQGFGPAKSIAIGAVVWLLAGLACYFAIKTGDARLWGLTIVGVPAGAVFLMIGISSLRQAKE